MEGIILNMLFYYKKKGIKNKKGNTVEEFEVFLDIKAQRRIFGN